MTVLPDRVDVAIAGGGLAGLCLARQLRRRLPELSVAVVEPSRRPLPEACHKVGESSVELGSHYFAHVLGLADYLDREHLYKNGLRFFVGEPKDRLAERTEIGPSRFPVVPSFQIDRGKFENDLRAMVEADGALLAEGWSVRSVALADDGGDHRLEIEGPDGAATVRARWVVDATGRRRLLARALGLGRPSRIGSSAAWFRVAGKVDVAELVPASETAFHRRDPEGTRWLSTVHLCGEGYWVWIIPLSTGHTSIGIVADPMHRFADFARPEGARAFLDAHEPALARRLSGVPMEDFRCIRGYAHECERILSARRFALVGEAGRFVDPLYSPGSDLIAFANGFVTELVADDAAGALDPARVDALEAFHAAWADDTTTMLHDTAQILATPEVFAAKVVWDFWVYWAFACQYFFQGLYRLRGEAHETFARLGRAFYERNTRAQRLLRSWAAVADRRVRRPFVGAPLFPSFAADRHLDLVPGKSPERTERLLADLLVEADEILDEIAGRALRTVPPSAARRLRSAWVEAGIARPPSAARRAAEDLRGGARRRALPRVARDVERILGRLGPEDGSLARAWGGDAPAPAAPSHG